MKYSHLMFDLDGTLIDSFPTIVEAYQLALEGLYGKREPDESKLIRLIGLPLKDFFSDYPEEDCEELVRLFAKNNDELQKSGVKYFEGVEEVLYKLKEKGVKLSIVTSKRKPPVLHWIEVMKAGELFDVVVAKEDTEKHKPFGDPIILAMKLAKAEKQDVLYIGDTEYDVLCAHDAGVDAAVVGWTASDKKTLEALYPEHWIENIEDLFKLV